MNFTARKKARRLCEPARLCGMETAAAYFFLAGAFFAGAFLAGAFFAGAFFTATLVAAFLQQHAFFAGAFLAGVFFAATFAGAFFAATFLVAIFFDPFTCKSCRHAPLSATSATSDGIIAYSVAFMQETIQIFFTFGRSDGRRQI